MSGRTSSLLLALVVAVVALWSSDCVREADAAAAIEDYVDAMSDDEIRDLLAQYGGPAAVDKRSSTRSRRARFCLHRDMTCPNLEKGDVCCVGSQCSCNLFGQNCKCSTMGLFHRLG